MQPGPALLWRGSQRCQGSEAKRATPALLRSCRQRRQGDQGNRGGAAAAVRWRQSQGSRARRTQSPALVQRPRATSRTQALPRQTGRAGRGAQQTCKSCAKLSATAPHATDVVGLGATRQ